MDTRSIESDLADLYKYKKLPDWLSQFYRDLFSKNVPYFLAVKDGPVCLHTIRGTVISNDFDRVVIGDYGAFVEFSVPAEPDLFITQPGQEYREKPPYRDNVKYLWLTVDDDSGIKIYKQLRGVTYADYKPGKYYVSVHEVLGTNTTLKE
ncbi:MAG: hypothetical protein J6S14_15835 [Clostridia bacterium]|nr:hypothetical protein [Clostridia bacterium]